MDLTEAEIVPFRLADSLQQLKTVPLIGPFLSTVTVIVPFL